MARQNNYPTFVNNSTLITAEFLNGLVDNVKTLNSEDGVFDISVANAVSDVPTKYSDLSSALSGNNVPVDVRKGGMSVKFINAENNEYEQWSLKGETWTDNVSYWGCMQKINPSEIKYKSTNVKDLLDEISAKLDVLMDDTDVESKFAYGVQWDKTESSPDCTRVGNMLLHAMLPVQSQMRGCLLDDNGNVVKYLNETDWSEETLDGSQGQVMVEIPKFYWKFSESGNTQSVMLSQVPIEGYTKVPKRYISAYEATVDNNNSSDTSTWKLASVKSMETRYRGGDNNGSRDNGYNSDLGMPRTVLTVGNYRTYARRRKSGTYEWNCYDYMSHKILCWLYVVEFATRYTQKSVSDTTTISGFKTGGLGVGVTDANWSKWTAFNSNCPFVPCGISDSLGNGSGQVQYVSYSGENASWATVQVPRYRGIENPFGHIWKMVDGAKVIVEPGGTTSGESKVYVCYTPSQYNSTDGNTANYTYIGNEPRSQNWVKEVVFGEGGDIFCKSNGGSATSYFTDQHYVSANPSSVETSLVLFGGHGATGVNAGFVFSYSSGSLSSKNGVFGSRLLFIPDAT